MNRHSRSIGARTRHSIRAGTLFTTLTVALVALAASGCADSIVGPGGQGPQPLVFRSHQPGNEPIYARPADIIRVDSDGTGAVNLTSHVAIYNSLSLSPDGRTMAFASDRSGSHQVWLMDTDGGNLRQLTTHGWNYGPRWSPDGTRIAHMHSRGDGLVVHVVNANGGTATAVDVSSDAIAADAPCGQEGQSRRLDIIGWTPDNRVLFTNYICGVGYRYYASTADGTSQVSYGYDPHNSYWTRDGSRIALTIGTGERRVMVMHSNGSGGHDLTTQPGDIRLPSRSLPTLRTEYNAWSPDGNRLFVETRASQDGQLAIALNTIRADGSNLVQVAGFPAEFNGWSWGSDQVAFTRLVDGVHDVYVVNADGTDLRRLMDTPGERSSALWLPPD